MHFRCIIFYILPSLPLVYIHVCRVSSTMHVHNAYVSAYTKRTADLRYNIYLQCSHFLGYTGNPRWLAGIYLSTQPHASPTIQLNTCRMSALNPGCVGRNSGIWSCNYSQENWNSCTWHFASMLLYNTHAMYLQCVMYLPQQNS